MRKHCIVCHSAKNLDKLDVSGGMALDSLEGIRKGGETKVVVPGSSADSMLVAILRHKDPGRRMPLDADPLPDETVALLKRWIDAGLPEGTRPKDDEPAVVVSAPKRLRKLDVVLPTKTPLPKNVARPNQTGPLELVLPIGPLAPVAAVAYSPNGKLLASGTYGRVTVWDTSTGRPVKVLTSVLGAVNDLKFSPDSSLLAVAGGQPSARGDLRLFSTADWKLQANLGGHGDVVSSVAFSPDGKFLASGSFDKTVRIWSVEAKQTVQTFTGHSDFVHAVAYGPKGDWLVSASKDRTVRLIDTKTGASKLTFSGMEQDVLAVAVRPDGQQVVSSGMEASLFWWNAQTGERLPRKGGGHDTATYEIAFTPKGELAASAGADKTVRLWNPQTGEQLRAVGTGSVAYAVALSPDGKQVAAGLFDGTVRVYEATTVRPLLTLLSVGGDTPDGDWLALTPEAFADGSDTLVAKARWQASGQALPAGPVWKALRQGELLGKALQGDKLPDAAFAGPLEKP